MSKKRNDSLAASARKEIPAPLLPYLPRDPKKYRPAIGLIGCGGIGYHHLDVYKRVGYRVVALCDIREERTKLLQKKFYPEADIYTDYRALLKRDDIEVVDVATLPAQRIKVLEAAIRARKHVLSQKPFVIDLDFGKKLADLADKQGVILAVNQNGRWAPHFSYMRNAIRKGLIGEIISINFVLNWDHTWVRKTPFNNVHHLILYDFAIHWFDIIAVFMPEEMPKKVYASVGYVQGQKLKPPIFGQVVIEYKNAQATLSFNGHSNFGKSDTTLVAGLKGTLLSTGPNENKQKVTLFTPRGKARPKLEGNWSTNGFHGTMAELLCSIEERRQPLNSARDNLRGLAICFAAVASADSGQPMVPGKVRKLSKGAA